MVNSIESECFYSDGVAAHAFGPGEYAISGDVHLDEEEDWTLSVNRKDGTNLLGVLIHEIGHALGLSHSKDLTSVMHPAFVSAKLDLNVDDIEHVQILYGKLNIFPELETSSSALKRISF